MRKTYEVHWFDPLNDVTNHIEYNSKKEALAVAACLCDMGVMKDVRVLVQIDPPAEKGGES